MQPTLDFHRREAARRGGGDGLRPPARRPPHRPGSWGSGSPRWTSRRSWARRAQGLEPGPHRPTSGPAAPPSFPTWGARSAGRSTSATDIPHLHPYRDLSAPTRGVATVERLVRTRGLGQGMVARMKETGEPLIATFYSPAIAADAAGLDNVWCVVTDSDINRVWAPRDAARSRIRYLVPSPRAGRRLRSYGVPAHHIHFTGFPLPHELVGGRELPTLRRNLAVAPRPARPDPRPSAATTARSSPTSWGRFPSEEEGRPPTLTFAVGGAGAQAEMAHQFLPGMRGPIEEGRLRLVLVAGVRGAVRGPLPGGDPAGRPGGRAGQGARDPARRLTRGVLRPLRRGSWPGPTRSGPSPPSSPSTPPSASRSSSRRRWGSTSATTGAGCGRAAPPWSSAIRRRPGSGSPTGWRTARWPARPGRASRGCPSTGSTASSTRSRPAPQGRVTGSGVLRAAGRGALPRHGRHHRPLGSRPPARGPALGAARPRAGAALPAPRRPHRPAVGGAARPGRGGGDEGVGRGGAPRQARPAALGARRGERTGDLAGARLAALGRAGAQPRHRSARAGASAPAAAAPAVLPRPAGVPLRRGAGVEIHRRWTSSEPGPATVWSRCRIPLVAGEPLTGLTRLVTMVDSANGISWELPLGRFTFVPVDMNLVLRRLPEGEWVGMAARHHGRGRRHRHGPHAPLRRGRDAGRGAAHALRGAALTGASAWRRRRGGG